jgi:hypothetical protein
VREMYPRPRPLPGKWQLLDTLFGLNPPDLSTLASKSRESLGVGLWETEYWVGAGPHATIVTTRLC